MSIWKYIFDSGLQKRADIEHLRERLDRTVPRTLKTASRIHELEHELTEAALLLRSLYVYLTEQPNFDAQRFAAIVSQLDASDGVKDGKISKRKKT